MNLEIETVRAKFKSWLSEICADKISLCFCLDSRNEWRELKQMFVHTFEYI